jgi:cyclopropane fatty-acyl-phospholipid synthase-like methyltransferase
VLDIGCGSGVPIARELIQRGFSVMGVDGAPEMLSLFRRDVPDGLAVLADMRELALEKGFAGILAWDSFFHLSPADQRAMFSRFRDHAAPDAVLMFTSGPTEGSAIGEFEGEPLYPGSLCADEYETLLGVAGFRVVDHVADDPSCGFRTVWLA